MPKVLICVADPQLFMMLRHILAAEHLTSLCATEDADLTRLHSERQDVRAILVDMIRPVPDLAHFLALAQTRFPRASLIAMVGNDTCDEGIAIDFRMETPFNPSRLIEFLRQLKKPQGLSHGNDVLRFDDIEMNLAAVRVTRAGQPIHLTALEFRLLRALLEDPAHAHDREALIAACWPDGCEVEPRTVDIHIGHIRRALAGKGKDVIRTIRGCGYGLETGVRTGVSISTCQNDDHSDCVRNIRCKR